MTKMLMVMTKVMITMVMAVQASSMRMVMRRVRGKVCLRIMI